MLWIYKASIILLFFASISLAVDMAFAWYLRFKQWRHRRKADARIIAQAKGAGVWDKKPLVLGGRALELKAWEAFKIRREPGEPDANLRRRCMAAEESKKEKREA